MLGTFDLTVFIFMCFITVISTFDTASCVFFVIINLSAVALFVLGESFIFLIALVNGMMHSICLDHH